MVWRTAMKIAASLFVCTVLGTLGPASAKPLHHASHRGYGSVNPIAASVVIGGIPAATSPNWAPYYYNYVPGQSYGYGPLPFVSQGGHFVQRNDVAQNGNAASCQQRFRSYDPSNGTYAGMDGHRHSCP
jgi:BA14K-like protein